MLRIRPFAAIHPSPNRASAVASVPYDVVSTAEARELARGNPHSFLHVIRPEIDLPETIDPHDDRVYAQGRAALKQFMRPPTGKAPNRRNTGDWGPLLTRDDQPRLFLYRQVMNHKPQVGLVCCCHIDDYAAPPPNDIIKKHERTRKDKEDDRTRHVLELNAHAEPVFLAYRGQPAIDAMVRADTNERPLFHFVAKDGITHTVWTVRDAQRYVDAFTGKPGVPLAYIADGHHRSASAARAGRERRAANPKHTGEEEYNWFLTVLFPADQLTILPYNRVVRDLNGLTPDAFLKRLTTVGAVRETDQPSPERPGVVCIYLAGRWHRLEFDLWHRSLSGDHGSESRATSDPINSLDVALLQERVLTPILGIGDISTDERIDFVGGIRGTKELERRVNSGQEAVAFSMHATTMDQLMAVADAGEIMPPKSTWFEPKLRSGLLIHSLD